MAFEYAGVDLPIREKTISSQRMSWEMIANPGRWWTGAERVEIARIGRAARDFEAVGSEILPEAAVYAIQKLVVDNANLNRDWYEEIIAMTGMTEDRYVELVAVVVHSLSIDEFHRALGLDLEPLPNPVSGEPTRQRPAIWPNSGTPGRQSCPRQDSTRATRCSTARWSGAPTSSLRSL